METANLRRRRFLQGAAAVSAATFCPVGVAWGLGVVGGAGVRTFGEMEGLAPGMIEPAGWLRVYLRQQAVELGSKLPEVSWPFTGAYWAGEEDPSTVNKPGQSWWPWEQTGYYIDGRMRLALALGDKDLLAAAEVPLRYTLGHVGADGSHDGYLGPQRTKRLRDGFARWPQAVFFRALMAASGSVDGVAAAMQKHYLGDTVDYSNGSRNVDNIEGMLWCYGQTGDARLLALAEASWAGFAKNAGGTERFPVLSDHDDLSAVRVFGDTPIVAHGVDYIEAAKQTVLLYLYTGRDEYLRFALAAQRRIFDFHMLIDGAPSTSEFYGETSGLNSHETCDIVDHCWTWNTLLMATGDGVWADRIERATFNAGMGAIKKDWKGLQYFSAPNQVSPTRFEPNPGGRVACCAGNVHRLLPNYALNQWMRTKDGGLAAVLYGASTVKADGLGVEIVQETEYPFAEDVRLAFRAAPTVAFPLALRIPKWCAAPRVTLNGKVISLPEVKRGFVTLQRRFRAGDVLVLTLPMQLKMTRWPQGGVGVERGPLVYSLGVAHTWSSSVVARYSTAAYPNWLATATGVWNFGMEDRGSGVRFEAKAMTTDPWVEPPVSLVVPMRRVVGWEMQVDPNHDGAMLTPALPDLSADVKTGAREMVALVPYGATHLRMTIFPGLGGVES